MPTFENETLQLATLAIAALGCSAVIFDWAFGWPILRALTTSRRAR